MLASLGALPLVGCGDYDPVTRSATGGTAGQAIGGLNTAGQTASGGSAGGGLVSVEASCDSVAPCGGDVVGTWGVAGSCLPVSGEANMSGFGLGCTAAPVTGVLEVAGAWTANADGTFTDNTTTSGASDIELPPECLNVSGTITTCDRLDGALQALGYASVICADSASGGCSCTGTIQQLGGMAFVALGAPRSGTYTTSNDVVAVPGRSPREYAYCVAGTTLTMSPQGMNITGALNGTIVLQKQ
jgi:hypothetical protein